MASINIKKTTRVENHKFAFPNLHSWWLMFRTSCKWWSCNLVLRFVFFRGRFWFSSWRASPESSVVESLPHLLLQSERIVVIRLRRVEAFDVGGVVGTHGVDAKRPAHVVAGAARALPPSRRRQWCPFLYHAPPSPLLQHIPA